MNASDMLIIASAIVGRLEAKFSEVNVQFIFGAKASLIMSVPTRDGISYGDAEALLVAASAPFVSAASEKFSDGYRGVESYTITWES